MFALTTDSELLVLRGKGDSFRSQRGAPRGREPDLGPSRRHGRGSPRQGQDELWRTCASRPRREAKWAGWCSSAGAVLSWSLYGPWLHKGQVGLGSPLRASCASGRPTSSSACWCPRRPRRPGPVTRLEPAGVTAATIAGVLGALGALCVIYVRAGGAPLGHAARLRGRADRERAAARRGSTRRTERPQPAPLRRLPAAAGGGVARAPLQAPVLAWSAPWQRDVPAPTQPLSARLGQRAAAPMRSGVGGRSLAEGERAIPPPPRSPCAHPLGSFILSREGPLHIRIGLDAA